MYGTFSATQIVMLKDYPTIIKRFPFSVTILGSVRPIIGDQIYFISTPALQILVDHFGVLPESYYGNELVESSLSAFILG